MRTADKDPGATCMSRSMLALNELLWVLQQQPVTGDLWLLCAKLVN